MPHWVWVVDTTTGHRFDVDQRSLRHGLARLDDPRYPDLKGPMARHRRPKHHVGKDGKPAPYVHGETEFDDRDDDAPRDRRPDAPSPTGGKPTGKTRTSNPAASSADTPRSEK